MIEIFFTDIRLAIVGHRHAQKALLLDRFGHGDGMQFQGALCTSIVVNCFIYLAYLRESSCTAVRSDVA
jgi:hypothetical protein